MKFTKVEGCGNHFILIDEINAPLSLSCNGHPTQEVLSREEIRALCDPHFGIGADGILWVRGHTQDDSSQETLSDSIRYEMIVYNADGSLAEMCGNGLRCVVWYLHKHYQYCADPQDSEHMLTGAGLLKVSVDARGLVSVEMGWPRVHTSLREEMSSLSGQLRLSHDELDKVGCYSLGNPHFVTYDVDHFKSRSILGPLWERAPRDGVNVSFAEVVNREAIKLHVYERGCGWTYGCGTGACAAVYHGYLNDRFDDGATIDVELPGGHLMIEISARGLVMWGGAREVYRGELLTSASQG